MSIKILFFLVCFASNQTGLYWRINSGRHSSPTASGIQMKIEALYFHKGLSPSVDIPRIEKESWQVKKKYYNFVNLNFFS